MVDEPTVLEAPHAILADIANESAALVAGVADHVGESPETVRAAVELTLRMLVEHPPIPKRIAIMRSAGAQAARNGVPAERFLQRFTSTTWVIWEATRAHPSSDRAVLEFMGLTLLRGIDLLVGAVADGYNAVDRETVAHDAEMRRALLEDLLSTASADPVAAARRRRMADRYGLNPNAHYRVIAAADRSGNAEADIEEGAHALGRRLRRPSRSGSHAASFPLPQVVTWRGLLVVLTRASWPAADRLPRHLDDLLGPDWVAVAGEPVIGVEGIAATMGRLTLSIRTALRIGREGWIASPDELALEELVTVDDTLLDAAVTRELGAILADGRMGPDLLETLEVYLDSGQNMREAGRRLHLAPRTVAYRLDRIASLLGHPLDGPAYRRLSVAAFANRMRREES
jgi:hypothetical protein